MGVIQTIPVLAEGDHTAWSASAGTPTDAVLADTGEYLLHNVLNDRNSFTIDRIHPMTTGILSMKVRAYAEGDPTAAIALYLRRAAANTDDGDIGLTGAYTEYVSSALNDPGSGVTPTLLQAQAMQIGVRNRTGAVEARVQSLMARLDTTVAAGVAASTAFTLLAAMGSAAWAGGGYLVAASTCQLRRLQRAVAVATGLWLPLELLQRETRRGYLGLAQAAQAAQAKT